MKEGIDFKIRVMCMTYNQAQYIIQTLDGFCEQKTNFPFVCVIMDDASNDGEINILKDYLNNNFEYNGEYIEKSEETQDYVMYFAQHKVNRNCYFAVYLLKYNHYQICKPKDTYIKRWNTVEYEAICEGDDYWIDSIKLQKQITFLDANPDFGLIYTNHYNRKNDEIVEFKEKGYTTFEELLISSGIGTLTACYRIDLYLKYVEEIKPQEKKWLMGDAPMWKYMAYNSKIKFIPDYTAVYRILQNSASHSTNFERRIRFIESGHQIQSFFINKYISDIREKASLQKRADGKMIKSVFNLYYVNKQEQKLSSFMKDNMVKLDVLERIKCYLKYVILKFKLRFA